MAHPEKKAMRKSIFSNTVKALEFSNYVWIISHTKIASAAKSPIEIYYLTLLLSLIPRLMCYSATVYEALLL